MQKIITCLWYNNQAEEAVKYYVDIFNTAPGSKKDSSVGKIARYDKASAEVSGQKEGSVLTVEFVLAGQDFIALNGGPIFKFTEANSYMIMCKTQEEVDHFWQMSANPENEQCGWMKDKFGLSWQVVPTRLNELLSDPDKAKAGRAMKAMLEMKKLVIADLEKAAGK